MNYEHIFDQLEISPDPFAVCELKGTCDLGLGQDATATLHYILRGQGTLQVRGMPDFPVKAGSLILVPALHSHTLRSSQSKGAPLPECNPAELKLRHLMKASPEGADSDQLIALCAHVRVGLRGAEDVVDLIRNPLVETVDEGNPLRPAMNLLVRELSTPNVGSRAMIRAVLTQCMIEMLRRRLHENDDALRWMVALRDPQVWAALRAMLDAPGDPHTVESLADQAGLSRSAFAKRFSAAYGSGPIDLLRDLRLRKAATLLRDTDLPVKRIAHMVGFGSRTSFSRLFDERTGQSPIQFRKAHSDRA